MATNLTFHVNGTSEDTPDVLDISLTIEDVGEFQLEVHPDAWTALVAKVASNDEAQLSIKDSQGNGVC